MIVHIHVQQCSTPLALVSNTQRLNSGAAQGTVQGQTPKPTPKTLLPREAR